MKKIRHWSAAVPCAWMVSLGAPAFAATFVEEHHHQLRADGPDHGQDSYALIRKAFGPRAIESPDLYRPNHRDVQHIIEDKDDVVGPHFVFLSHLEADRDRDKALTDRQRNEIKVYDKSKTDLKAFENDTLQYRWKFKIDSGFEFSKRFTHFFQIKARNERGRRKPKDSDKFPVLTFTGVDGGRRGNGFQVRHSPSLDADGKRIKFSNLVQKDMALFTGYWIEFFVQITFHDEGHLIVKATNFETGEVLIDIEQVGIDMWRGEGRGDFSRPKWGIYRSVGDKASLRADEEKARFADFSIRKGKLVD
ncbi:MAG: hypothetical protein AB8G17_13075 [Gammaproteobacteria bacterium]